ncbi:MAG: glycosyltransferase family 39 protein [Prochlorotrichaceae cyanobacterium]
MRFSHLDSKPYWYDEVYTSLRLSGYTKIDIFQWAGTEQKDFGSLNIFQCPNSDRNLGDVLNGVIMDDSHPPLYFTVLYYWTKFVGCTVKNLRLFSALSSLLLIPIIYALIDEIFHTRSISLLTTAFVINSPIFLIYAQEARHYILFILLALSSSLILFRWLKHKNQKNLIIYTLLSTIGLYTHTLYYGVVLSQALYCLLHTNLDRPINSANALRQHILSNFYKNKKIFVALFMSFLIFMLWILRVIQLQGLMIRAGADYTWKPMSTQVLWQRILFNVTSLFSDFEDPLKSEIITQNSVDLSILNLQTSHIFLIVFSVLILLASLWYTLRYSDRSRIALLGWLAVPSLLFLTKDLVLGGSSSSIIRYQLLSVFGLYAAISFCLVHLFQTTSLKWVKGITLSVIVLLLQLQIASNFNYLNAESWWSRYGDYQLYEFARRVHQSPHPIVLAEANYREMVNLLKLSHVLDPTVPFQLRDPQDLPDQTLSHYEIFWVPQI